MVGLPPQPTPIPAPAPRSPGTPPPKGHTPAPQRGAAARAGVIAHKPGGVAADRDSETSTVIVDKLWISACATNDRITKLNGFHRFMTARNHLPCQNPSRVAPVAPA